MESRKTLRIGKSVVHGRTGPLRGDIGHDDEEEKKKNIKQVCSSDTAEGHNKYPADTSGSRSGNRRGVEDKKEEEQEQQQQQQKKKKVRSGEDKNVDDASGEDILNSHFNKDDNEHNSGDIFEQLLQRELAKGALGGGVVEKNANKLKANIEKANLEKENVGRVNMGKANTGAGGKMGKEEEQQEQQQEQEEEDLSKINLMERINSAVVKHRMHGYSEVIKCFCTEGDMDRKTEILGKVFREEDSVLKYISDTNLICQIKATEMTEAYITTLKEIYIHTFRHNFKSEDALINAFVNENRNKLCTIFTKIYNVLCEKILTNTKSFDSGYNIVSKIIEYSSSDKITLNVITLLCEYIHNIYLKSDKSVSCIKGVKIKIISSILLLFYKLLKSFRANIICVKTINKYCFKFNEMIDKSVKTNFYLLYIEILSQIKNCDFQNIIMNDLNSQQKNYITKELQKEEHNEYKSDNIKSYLINQKGNDGEMCNDMKNNLPFGLNINNLIDETDVFKDICTKQWEKRVLEGSIDKNSNTNNTSLSNENLLPWKIKVEAINLLYDKLKSKYAIKKTSYISNILNIIYKLLKNESALPVVVSTLKLLHILIDKFEKDIYNTVKNFSFILCSKLKDSNKQVSNACMECLTKAISMYSIDIFIEDLSKNLKDKNNNTRLVTLEFLLKNFDYIDRKNIIPIIDVTKHLLNDTVANIKNTTFKVYSLIIVNYGEDIYPSFFTSLPSNKKKSILTMCTNETKKKKGFDEEENSPVNGYKKGGEFLSKSTSKGGDSINLGNSINNDGVNYRLTNDTKELLLPNTIMKNLSSHSYTSKIEALHLLSEWIKIEINLMNVNLNNLVQNIKTNCYDFKGKYTQLNTAIYDFFNHFVDVLHHFNINHMNNPSFIKIMNILMSLYLDKVTDKKEGIICTNFLHKCFLYFDNNVVIDVLIKNNDTKNAKKCEECIKILQKIFLNKNPTTSNVNIKSLIYFLKKFVDSKNTNLKNSSILMLQILCKNFGDKYVLSYLEGISENIRQVVKAKEDVDRFAQKHGAIPVPAMGKQSHGRHGATATNVVPAHVNGKSGEQAKKPDFAFAHGGGDVTLDESSTTRHRNVVQIDYTNAYLSYKASDEVSESGHLEEKQTDLEQKTGLTKPTQELRRDTISCTGISTEVLSGVGVSDHGVKSKFVKRTMAGGTEEEVGEKEKEEEEEEEEMINVSDAIRQYVSQISSEGDCGRNSGGVNFSPHSVAVNTSKIINVIEQVGKYYIHPDKLDMLINSNMLQKIYNGSKSKCVRLVYVLLFSLRENTERYADVLFEFVVRIIDDADVSSEQIDRLLTCMCKNIGISKYITQINNYILSERMHNCITGGIITEGNSNGGNGNGGNGNGGNGNGGNGNGGNGNGGYCSNVVGRNGKRILRRNKILIVINNINTNHILLLNEKVIKKKVLKFYLDFFFDDNEQVREKASLVLDHIYSKYGKNIFFEIYEKLTVHKKECLHDIFNQMKLNKENFSFYKIFSSNNLHIKRLSNNESNISGTTPTMSKTKSVKRLSSFNKNKMMKIEFPAYYKIKTDKLKWDKNLDQSHLGYLMREFKFFGSQELISHMFSENVNMLNRSISFFKDYLVNSSSQSTFFSKSGFLDLLLKWIFYTLYGHQNNSELICASTNLIRIILKTIEDNYVFLNDQELVILVNFIFDKINSSVTSSEIRKKLKEILLCLCYVSNHKLYFALLLKSLSSSGQKRICDSLDVILKLIILYKDKCLNVERDVMKILQVFTVHSKNKNVTICCLKIFANIQSFCPNFYKCIDNDDISYYLKSKVDEFIEKCPDYKVTSKDSEDEENNSAYQSENSEGIRNRNIHIIMHMGMHAHITVAAAKSLCNILA
ncbi:conserved Plasmodium protein, unknown function [Plasmodium ovale curtisi]|uniref:TOG domain-containing protein n=1 Tax=Plasmodium ovale curtisi TaxID=864141 RepID=A0A1A8WUG3_PLAOA|nr:conserved Plasmodium protein, unknown function [Plasmodium ovale curtisi]